MNRIAAIPPRGRERRRLLLERLDDRVAPALFTVNSILDIDDNLPFDPKGTTTLRKAIRLANDDDILDIISFAKSLKDQKIKLGGTELAITKPVTINGLGADQL